jgi:tRNA-2-methylthio-N6-dimethylallyladenosine synthase
VLFEKPGRHPGQLIGRTRYLQAIHAEAPERLIGAEVDVEVLGLASHSLAGAVVTGDSQQGVAA